MQAIRTYVINLDGSDARLAGLRTKLEAFGIDFERVAAVDGRAYDLASLPDYDLAAAKRFMGRGLVGGEIGCYYSHLKAARTFLQSDARHALVLEDDAEPLCNVLELLEAALPDIDALDPDWLLLNVGNNRLKLGTAIEEYPVGSMTFELVAAHYFPMTTNAIVWSREGARRFVTEHATIFAPVDNFFRYWLTREGHGYSFRPAPVTTTGADSLILSDKGARRQTGNRSWFYQLVKQKRLAEEKLLAWRKKRNFRLLRKPVAGEK
ncbi:glycosyltransferase family 25 protein [Shinella curvata]|uniref:Glycosyltransferase family 25 protein n=1 Tax=Shinella curvata TaxID=1817964 RepID=A0ABT8XK78_9HYPH|nr:glycosyltransferase family 25 protein [Shinella curvata]MCJ8052586.1 glycosyltransferase family 25 protein [Shinella curvata]MDO6123666.1 glycosyltransferase family 25 protein [Shinella curvata]